MSMKLLLCASTLAVLLCLPASPASLPPPEYQKLTHDIYKQLIEINTSFSTGATTPAAQAVAERLKAEGFAESDIQVLGAAPHKMNVVVRYHGTGQRKPLLLLAHLDVVEAKRSDWSMDPFVLTEKDGFYYGRGTIDDKAQAAIWVANLIRYKREGWKPDRDIIVALTADEEGGGPYNGVAWLLKNHRDLIDAEFCLNEGGWGYMANGKRVSNNVQVSEKYVGNYRLEVKNKGGHSSLPVPDNAIYRLAEALVRLSKYKFPVHTNDVTKAFLEQMAKIQPEPVSSQMKAASEGSEDAMEKLSAGSTELNAMLRTTCVATMLDGGHALNALPQTAGAMVNCRILPETKPEEVLATLKKVVADDQVSITVTREMEAGPPSPMRPDLFRAASRITDSMWPGVLAIPTMVMGATDGLYLRSAGIPTYGVQGIFIDDFRAHGRDERVGINEFYEGSAFLYELVKSLAQN
ncbi:MAG: M20/M25/M40 family metallo-hydrolase [Bryobacteraceae bacterium]|jgi:acetylornithine deacetylase/succinyl-diaminopimelate desuccinylase-like protein